jgi:hypothetical protein
MPRRRSGRRSYASLGEYLLNHDDLVNARRILLGICGSLAGRIETARQGSVALRGATGKDTSQPPQTTSMWRWIGSWAVEAAVEDRLLRPGRGGQGRTPTAAGVGETAFDSVAVPRRSPRAGKRSKPRSIWTRTNGSAHCRSDVRDRVAVFMKKYQPADLPSWPGFTTTVICPPPAPCAATRT